MVAVLGTLGYLILHRPVKGRYFKLTAQRRLNKSYRNFKMNVIPVAAEYLVGFDVDRHEQIAVGAAPASGLALAPGGNGLAVVDAGGNFYVNILLNPDTAAAAALLARLFYNFAAAAAGAAGPLTVECKFLRRQVLVVWNWPRGVC